MDRSEHGNNHQFSGPNYSVQLDSNKLNKIVKTVKGGTLSFDVQFWWEITKGFVIIFHFESMIQIIYSSANQMEG